MDSKWMQCFLLFALVLPNYSIYGQSEVEVRLVVRKYVEKGSSVTLYCEHNVEPKILYKVTWLKENTGKFFQYIKDRNPPFRNFSIPGAEIDWKNSNEGQVQLANIDFEAAGKYYCEVSTDTPIFTKESEVEQMHVIVQQTGPPRITFSKRQFTVGENLVANCTTSKAHPAPHITWLINGKQVEDRHIKTIRLHPSTGSGSGTSASSGSGKHRSKTHQSNNPSYDKYEPSAVTHGRGNSGSPVLSLSSTSQDQKEPLDANGNHLGFEIHQNSGYDNSKSTNTNSRDGSSYSGSGIYNRNSHNTNNNNNNNNNNNRNGGYYGMSGEGRMNSNIETSDHFDDKRYETRKHRNSNHSHRKYRRYTNELTNSPNANRHHLMATSSQLSVEVSELHALNGRLEISCLATIPAHVKPGEQYADYKTYSVKIDIDQAEPTTVLPAMSDMAALGNSSNRSNLYTLRMSSTISLSLTIVLVILFNLLQTTHLRWFFL